MFKYLKKYEINKFKNHKRSYKKYWFKFIDSKIKYNIWWDCTFNSLWIVDSYVRKREKKREMFSPQIFAEVEFTHASLRW